MTTTIRTEANSIPSACVGHSVLFFVLFMFGPVFGLGGGLERRVAAPALLAVGFRPTHVQNAFNLYPTCCYTLPSFPLYISFSLTPSWSWA